MTKEKQNAFAVSRILAYHLGQSGITSRGSEERKISQTIKIDAPNSFKLGLTANHLRIGGYVREV